MTHTDTGKLIERLQFIIPYLDWTIGPESPGHHPTMPSAVRAFKNVFAELRSLPEVAPTKAVEGAVALARLLRRNLAEGDRRMAIENCDILIAFLETGEKPKSLDDLHAIGAEIKSDLTWLTDEERVAIRQMGDAMELSDHAVMRQALRHYQLLRHRLAAGETFSFSGDAERSAEFAGPLAQRLSVPGEIPREASEADIRGAMHEAIAGSDWKVEGSIYEGFAAAISKDDRTVAHVVDYGDALMIAAALSARPSVDGSDSTPAPNKA